MIQINEEKFRDLFFTQNCDVTDIAREFNCVPATIFRYIKKNALHRVRKACHFEDITGQKFHFLTPIHYVRNDKFGKALWLCKCDCGNERIINAASMKKGLTKSCGCYKRAKNSTGYQLISGAFWHKLQKSAVARNYEITITIEEAWLMFEQQNQKCALSGVDIILHPCHDFCKKQTASPDRKDSNLGYTKDNFQWVHKRVNRLKNILSDKELIFWCRQIVSHNTEYPYIEFDCHSLAWG